MSRRVRCNTRSDVTSTCPRWDTCAGCAWIHARRQLLAADPATTTVQAVAARWGFAHTGRFSACPPYRHVRREGPPSDTLS